MGCALTPGLLQFAARRVMGACAFGRFGRSLAVGRRWSLVSCLGCDGADLRWMFVVLVLASCVFGM